MSRTGAHRPLQVLCSVQIDETGFEFFKWFQLEDLAERKELPRPYPIVLPSGDIRSN